VGIVHGVSGSGATVYVKPIETVELNNQIVTLRDREAAEIQRLLQEYSDLLRGVSRSCASSSRASAGSTSSRPGRVSDGGSTPAPARLSDGGRA